MMSFTRKLTHDNLNLSMISSQGNLTTDESDKLERIKRAWNFYDGYHWEEIPSTDKPQITENYCRAFVNKFVSFEFGKGFTTKYSNKLSDVPITKDGLDNLEFVNKVWDYNLFEEFCVELGQSKSITGDSWVQVKYFSEDEIDDPFGEHPDGMIKVMVIPTSVVFPEYDVHEKTRITRLTIMYPIEAESTEGMFRRTKIKKVLYKQIWTKDTVTIIEGEEMPVTVENKYGTIPFIQIKNFPIVGRSEGLSDLEDIIPLNVEMNMKKSDISEIIDYHSAPVTVVFGARIASLEKGANKIWGGLPKDSKVQNLELNSDLMASVRYIDGLKTAMHEIGGVPEGALGGTQAISNTSGVALQFINMPLIEKTRVKRLCSKSGLEEVTKLILLIAEKEELITVPLVGRVTDEFPEGVPITRYDFFFNEVTMPDTLPKDELIELQQIQTEMSMKLESRKGAMRRIGKDDIDALIEEIDTEVEEEEDKDFENQKRLLEVNLFMEQKREEQALLNSGLLNGETPVEQVRKEISGANIPLGD